ncbi:MAG: Rieske 2Fe-2S domain-containing protein [Pseudomonadales bacterium]|nr:Rieske 2Fe-2S domain-containing protein [Pseudomonadales bacterium]
MNSTIPLHTIEAKKADRYGRGWYCFGLSRHISEEPQTFEYFGTKLVAYRSLADFKIKILDAYCPHMGADLSKGECDEQGNIVCPFHHWSWGGDGVCNHIPYAEKIPPKAKIKSWDVLELNGLFYVWYDHEGNPPIPGQEPPRMEEYYSDEWSEWNLTTMRIASHGRELIDNMADMAHFGPVHSAPAAYFKNIIDKHMFVQYMEGDPETMETSDSLTSTATYYGPAIMTTVMENESNGLVKHSRLLVTHVPVDQEHFDLRFGLIVKKYPEFGQDINDYIVQKYVDGTTEAFFEDVDIWKHKTQVDNPVLCSGDGPVYKLRQWYEQFYTDIADLPSTFDERKEYVTLDIYGKDD